ncbi:hypothetical protein GALL_403890 [mine drainage metagenome]|uniref:Uncharacterized protein n=1 Tax=mine drainage metagenome TaxID=410659 RepID=A0A1J5QK71_9ZZZZ
MKLHQSAWAELPCASNRPGLPTSPQVSTSILVPSEVTKPRSGSLAMASVNHLGASGSRPWKGASGAWTSGGRAPGSEWIGWSS